jgi:hypothetical protein
MGWLRERALLLFDLVMPGLDPGIHAFFGQDVDGRDKPGHDE